jgi:hypothetical protein
MTDQEESVAFNLTPEQMTSILAEAATKKRTVVEFRTQNTEEGRELHQALEITDYVKELEENNE